MVVNTKCARCVRLMETRNANFLASAVGVCDNNGNCLSRLLALTLVEHVCQKLMMEQGLRSVR